MSSTHGFIGKDGQIYLTRCPRCRRENYAPAVATGTCAWCTYAAETTDVEDDE